MRMGHGVYVSLGRGVPVVGGMCRGWKLMETMWGAKVLGKSRQRFPSRRGARLTWWGMGLNRRRRIPPDAGVGKPNMARSQGTSGKVR